MLLAALWALRSSSAHLLGRPRPSETETRRLNQLPYHGHVPLLQDAVHAKEKGDALTFEIGGYYKSEEAAVRRV